MKLSLSTQLLSIFKAFSTKIPGGHFPGKMLTYLFFLYGESGSSGVQLTFVSESNTQTVVHVEPAVPTAVNLAVPVRPAARRPLSITILTGVIFVQLR